MYSRIFVNYDDLNYAGKAIIDHAPAINYLCPPKLTVDHLTDDIQAAYNELIKFGPYQLVYVHEISCLDSEEHIIYEEHP